MKGQKAFRIFLAASTLAAIVGATEANAASCSASGSIIISRSAGGTCPLALSLNEEFTMTYRFTNASIVDDGSFDPVAATIQSGNTITATLAQATSGVLGTHLPDVLEMVPVCPVGSVGGSVAVGDECLPGECGTGTCGCVESLPGITCTANGDNLVDFDFGSDLDFPADTQLEFATIRVRLTDVVGSPATCGLFFTRVDTDGDVLETEDALCDTVNTAGAQGSANLHAPVCASDADCGDTECNVCADIDTDNHCEVANEGLDCGTDGDPDDCQTPACVDNAGVGECQQNVNDEPEGTDCDDGEEVSCTNDICDDDGECTHVADDDECDDLDPCTADNCDVVNGCDYTDICVGGAICRSPGYWGTHAGTEKTNSIDVAQAVIDAVGGSIEVCGQTITDTSALGTLDSSTEGICVKGKGVKERQLYRQLVAAALNCAISGGNGACDGVLGPLTEVSFDDCSDLCAGTPVVDGPTIGECVGNLDCFNNGGHMIDGSCVYGTCSGSSDGCDIDDDCPGDETCDLFLDNCHNQEICNEGLGVCPKSGPAGSSTACKTARGNDCTIDDCN